MSWADVVRFFFVALFLAVLIAAVLPAFHNPDEGVYIHQLFDER